MKKLRWKKVKEKGKIIYKCNIPNIKIYKLTKNNRINDWNGHGHRFQRCYGFDNKDGGSCGGHTCFFYLRHAKKSAQKVWNSYKDSVIIKGEIE